MKDKERELIFFFTNPLLCRRAVELLGFGFFYAPPHIAYYTVKIYIKKIQLGCGVTLRGGGAAPVVVFVVSCLQNAKSVSSQVI